MAYSKIDTGQIGDLFDGDRVTLIRGLEANPFLIDITFPTPRDFSAIRFATGSMRPNITATIYAASQTQPLQLKNTWRDLQPDPNFEWILPERINQVTRVQLEITDQIAGEPAHLHLRELSFAN